MEILCYTREPKEDDIYAARLAYSMHLAYRAGESEWVPFHHNEGFSTWINLPIYTVKEAVERISRTRMSVM